MQIKSSLARSLFFYLSPTLRATNADSNLRENISGGWLLITITNKLQHDLRLRGPATRSVVTITETLQHEQAAVILGKEGVLFLGKLSAEALNVVD